MAQIRESGGIKSLHKAEDRKVSTIHPVEKKTDDTSLTALLEEAFVSIKTAANMSSSDDDSDSTESWSEEDC